MRVYYNEWDRPTAEWLRQICAGNHLPAGHVDTRSIRDVRAEDVRGYDQAHFFAGIGGWPLGLRLAGYGHLPCWTGSPPCQPFSVAGQQRGNDDERHLAPVWLNLVRECKPPILFGEQVEAAIRHGWLDDLFDALEAEGYACGAAVLPACSVGAPHIRKRLFFGAIRLADAMLAGWSEGRTGTGRGSTSGSIGADGMAHTHQNGCCPRGEIRSVCAEHDPEHGGAARGVAYTHGEQHDRFGIIGKGWRPEHPDGSTVGRSAPSHHGRWAGADWLGCRDGKFRPVEPGTQPLAHGVSARVGRLRGYGNAIVPQVAAVFIQEFLGAFAEIQENL